MNTESYVIYEEKNGVWFRVGHTTTYPTMIRKILYRYLQPYRNKVAARKYGDKHHSIVVSHNDNFVSKQFI